MLESFWRITACCAFAVACVLMFVTAIHWVAVNNELTAAQALLHYWRSYIVTAVLILISILKFPWGS